MHFLTAERVRRREIRAHGKHARRRLTVGVVLTGITCRVAKLFAGKARTTLAVRPAVARPARICRRWRTANTKAFGAAVFVREARIDRDALIAVLPFALPTGAPHAVATILVGLALVVHADGLGGRGHGPGKEIHFPSLRRRCDPIEALLVLHAATVAAVGAFCIGFAAVFGRRIARRNDPRRTRRGAGDAGRRAGAILAGPLVAARPGRKRADTGARHSRRSLRLGSGRLGAATRGDHDERRKCEHRQRVFHAACIPHSSRARQSRLPRYHANASASPVNAA